MRAPRLLSNSRTRTLGERFRLSMTQLLSWGLTLSIIGLSVTLVVFTSASIAWVSNYYSNGNGIIHLVAHNYTYSASYGYSSTVNATWRNTVYYGANRLSMDDVYAMLAGGVLGILISLLLLSMPFWLRKSYEMELSLPLLRRKTRKVDLSHQNAIVALDALLSILLLIVAILVWVRYAQSPYPSIWRLPQHQLDYTVNLGPYPKMTFEVWTCAFTGYMADNATAPSSEELGQQCIHAGKSRHLVIPLMVLAVVRLGLRPMAMAFGTAFKPVEEFMEWKKHTREMREGHGTELNDVRHKRLEDEEVGGQGRDSVQDEGGSHQSFIAELPGWRMSRTEMDQDAAVVEAPGVEGGKEMDAGIAAVEKDAGERRSGEKT